MTESILHPEVKAYLDSHRESHLNLLCELLRFASIANVADPDGCGPCAQWLVEYLTKLGFAAEVLPTEGQPCVLASLHVDDALPTVLVYGHYDVQPPDPLEQWQSDPFEPEVRDGWLYARGADDDKGQVFTHLMAVEAWIRSGQSLPVNLKFLIEGEEEIGSPNIESFINAHIDRLAADALVISDTAFFDENTPAITNALRGVLSFEITTHGPNRDVHSGAFGGILANPVNALAKMIGAMHDDTGRVTIPGFYDDVVAPSQEELDSWKSLAVGEAALAAEMGVDSLGGGEAEYSLLERNWARPTLDCNGFGGGYQGPGGKTIIPATATAKLSVRMVHNMQPEKIQAAIREFVQANTPAGIRSEIKFGGAGQAVKLATDSPAALAGRQAMAEAFGHQPAYIRNGASVPITEVFHRLLGLDAVMLGVGLPEDNLHSPNEKFKLTQLYNGAVMSAAFLQRFAQRWAETK